MKFAIKKTRINGEIFYVCAVVFMDCIYEHDIEYETFTDLVLDVRKQELKKIKESKAIFGKP